MKILALVSGLVASSLIAARAAEGDRPFIPSFWDPQAQIEKPDLDKLGPIRFVTGTDYPPFNVALPDGTVVGFNVDLARAICAELELSCTIQGRPWTELKTVVTEGKADAAIASMTIDPKAAGLAFTSSYFRTPARFVARKPIPDGEADATPALDDKRVGVEAGTAQEAYLRTFFPKAIVVALPSADAAHAALKAGHVEALFLDATATALWLDSADGADCCGFWGGPFTESRFLGPGAGIAVRADDDGLRRALDYALARLAAKGVYADLYLRYFPISPF